MLKFIYYHCEKRPILCVHCQFNVYNKYYRGVNGDGKHPKVCHIALRSNDFIAVQKYTEEKNKATMKNTLPNPKKKISVCKNCVFLT